MAITAPSHSSKTRAAAQRKSKSSPSPTNKKTAGLHSLLQRAIDAPQQLSPAEVLRLSSLSGNRAVTHMLTQGRQAIQKKLTVGAANDAYEQEADQVAQQVMSGPQGAPSAQGAANVQRAAGEEEEVQTLPLISRLAQRLPTSAEAPQPTDLSGSFEAGDTVSQAILDSKGAGSPLPGSLRRWMEPRFGADFSDVRVHSDAQSAQINRSLGAQAFTHGSDIYMGAGKYDPNHPQGQQILAHELTHTIQQGAVSQGGAARRMRSSDAAPKDNKVQTLSTQLGVQRVPSRANFIKLAGDVSSAGTRNKSLYWQILNVLDAYQAVKDDKKKKNVELQRLIHLIIEWMNKHSQHVKEANQEFDPAQQEDYFDNPQFLEGDKMKDKEDVRKASFLGDLIQEAKAEIKGEPLADDAPSALIAEQAAKTQAANTQIGGLDAVNGTKFEITIAAAIEHKDYLAFARKRLNLRIANFFKPLFKQTNKQMKHKAAEEVVAERYKELAGKAKEDKIKELENMGAQVGHTWVSFQVYGAGNKVSKRDSFGFWPLRGFNDPEIPVPGTVRHPDDVHDHDPDQLRQTFTIDKAQYTKGMSRALTIEGSPPDYKLIDYNCTKFARDVALTTGVSFPENAFMRVPKGSMKAFNPNALFEEFQKSGTATNPVEQERKRRAEFIDQLEGLMVKGVDQYAAFTGYGGAADTSHIFTGRHVLDMARKNKPLFSNQHMNMNYQENREEWVGTCQHPDFDHTDFLFDPAKFQEFMSAAEAVITTMKAENLFAEEQ